MSNSTKGASVAEVEAQLPAFFDRHGFTEDMKTLEPQLPVFPDHGVFAHKYFRRADRMGVDGTCGPYAFVA